MIRFVRRMFIFFKFSRTTARNPGRCQKWKCAKERNGAQYRILTSMSKKVISLTEVFRNGYFEHFLMPLTDQLKFLDLCSLRTREPGSAEGTHSRCFSLSRGDPFAADYAVRIWFSLISKLKLFARGVILSNLIKNCEGKLTTVELVRLERNVKSALFLTAHQIHCSPQR